MTSLKRIESVCSPALVYFVLSVIAFLSMLRKISLMTVVVNAFFILLWTWFLNFLCKKGHSGISWFLVLFPFILMPMIFFLAADVMFSGLGGGREGFGFATVGNDVGNNCSCNCGSCTCCMRKKTCGGGKGFKYSRRKNTCMSGKCGCMCCNCDCCKQKIRSTQNYLF